MLELYKNIRKYRKELGMSQAELAKKTGYNDRSSIAKIERGDVDLPQSKIILFANALNVSPGKLMGNVDSVSESSFLDTQKEYYEDPETARLAQEMFEDRDMRMLFDMKKSMTPERFARQMETFRDMYRLEHPEEFPEDWTD